MLRVRVLMMVLFEFLVLIGSRYGDGGDGRKEVVVGKPR